MKALTLSFAPLLLPALAAAQGSVLVVDAAGGPGAAFTSLSAAVNAAAPNDVLVVRSGTYAEPLSFGTKPLVVVAEPGANVQAERAVIGATAAGATVLVRGLVLSNTENFSGSASASTGTVWFEDTTFLGVPVPPGQMNASGALRVDSCVCVVVSRCTLTRPFVSSPIGALHSTVSSRFHVYDSLVTGQPHDVGAIVLGSSFLELAGSTVDGGDGAAGMGVPFCTAQNGGDGLVLSGASQALVRGSSVTAGTGGAPCGQGGEPFVIGAGGSVSFQSAPGTYEIDALVRDDETLHASFHASPGDQVVLLFATSPGAGIAAGVLDGELLLDLATLDGLVLGAVPPSGVLELTTAAPVLAAGAESLVLYTQAVLRSPGGRFRMATPSALVVIDDAF